MNSVHALMALLAFVSFSVFTPSFAHAISPEEDSFESLLGIGLGDVNDYQIGSEWGKREVTPDLLRGMPRGFVRAAAATARFGGGTSFYLGKFNGHYMMATNYHVMPKAKICDSRSAIFPLLKKKFQCEKFYGHWTGIDLALFSIKVESAEDEAMLAKVAGNFNFQAELAPGFPLATIGFGVFRNDNRVLMANADSDCKVFSARNDFRFIADPDRINPADYKAWSFANGCDVSHGDSGSAMVDRRSGQVVGIIWTAATNKNSNIQDSSYLDGLLRSNSGEIWEQLSYAVPAAKIKSFLTEFLATTTIADKDLVETINAVLTN